MICLAGGCSNNGMRIFHWIQFDFFATSHLVVCSFLHNLPWYELLQAWNCLVLLRSLHRTCCFHNRIAWAGRFSVTVVPWCCPCARLLLCMLDAAFAAWDHNVCAPNDHAHCECLAQHTQLMVCPIAILFCSIAAGTDIVAIILICVLVVPSKFLLHRVALLLDFNCKRPGVIATVQQIVGTRGIAQFYCLFNKRSPLRCIK